MSELLAFLEKRMFDLETHFDETKGDRRCCDPAQVHAKLGELYLLHAEVKRRMGDA